MADTVTAMSGYGVSPSFSSFPFPFLNSSHKKKKKKKKKSPQNVWKVVNDSSVYTIADPKSGIRAGSSRPSLLIYIKKTGSSSSFSPSPPAAIRKRTFASMMCEEAREEVKILEKKQSHLETTKEMVVHLEAWIRELEEAAKKD